MDKITDAFPGIEFNSDTSGHTAIWTIAEGINVTITIDSDNGYDLTLWDSKGTDFRGEMKAAVDEMKRMNEDSPVMLLRILRENLNGSVAGFDLDPINGNDEFPPYDPKTDPLVPRMKKIADQKRELMVYTYGTRYIFEDLKDSERCYNAAILRGVRTKELFKLRGTDPVIQQTVRSIPEFVPFIKNIIVEIERDDLNTISIICRGGHHRSVTAAEWLRHIYPEIVVKHLTIDH